jgi:hypothetical protein
LTRSLTCLCVVFTALSFSFIRDNQLIPELMGPTPREGVSVDEGEEGIANETFTGADAWDQGAIVELAVVGAFIAPGHQVNLFEGCTMEGAGGGMGGGMEGGMEGGMGGGMEGGMEGEGEDEGEQ